MAAKLKDISKLDKDQLEAYAKQEFKVELDKRKKIADLRVEVTALQKGEVLVPANAKDEVVEKPCKYLRHPDNKRVFEHTGNLAARGDMIPCDADGNNI